jgi:hypothetical protein
MTGENKVLRKIFGPKKDEVIGKCKILKKKRKKILIHIAHS